MYGQALSITFTDEMLKKSKVNVKINYETTPECSACQWLEPRYILLIHIYIYLFIFIICQRQILFIILIYI